MVAYSASSAICPTERFDGDRSAASAGGGRPGVAVPRYRHPGHAEAARGYLYDERTDDLREVRRPARRLS